VNISVALKDLNNALAALECLAQLNIAYQPTYAGLLANVGMVDDARRVYEHYLSQSPTDIPNQIKFGNLLKAQGDHQGAASIASNILAEDPGNSSAKALLS